MPESGRPHKRLLQTLAAGWVVTGVFGAFSWAAAWFRNEGGRLATVNALFVELALFGYVCWLLLGVMLGFPLYYWLLRRGEDHG